MSAGWGVEPPVGLGMRRCGWRYTRVGVWHTRCGGHGGRHIRQQDLDLGMAAQMRDESGDFLIPEDIEEPVMHLCETRRSEVPFRLELNHVPAKLSMNGQVGELADFEPADRFGE